MLAGTQKPMLGTKLNRAHPLAKGLRGCWLFNEGIGNVAYDSSGYGNHGTLTNMAAPPTTTSGWNPGKNGVGLAFDGANDYIDCGNDSSLDITDAIAIEMWAKGEGGTYRSFLSKGYSYSEKKGLLFRFYSSHYLALEVGNGTNLFTLVSDEAVTQNIWHHLVGYWDGITMRLAIDGVVQTNTTAFSGTIVYTSENLKIGISAANVYPFFGSIDEMKIYNRAFFAVDNRVYRASYCMFERGELLL